MPTGIIMQSSSVGATQEAIEKVFVANGLEPEKQEAAAAGESTEAAVEPKREEFESDEAFAAAQEEFESKQEEQEEKEAAEAERKRLEALPKKTRRQKAVDKATADLRAKNRELADRVAALESKGTKTEPKAEELKAPKRDDFKTDAEFDDAMFDYRYRARRAKEAAEESQNKLKAGVERNYAEYQTAAAAFKEEHDDWEEVVGKKLQIPESVYFAIVDLADEGPAVSYYLGSHPEEIEKLAELTPYRAAIEVGRISDKLKAGNRSTSTEKATKPAPKRIAEPVRPLSTSATTSTQTSRDAATARDFKAFKAAQRRGA